MENNKENETYLQRLKKKLKGLVSGKISYTQEQKVDKGDAGEITKKLKQAKQSNATKSYDDALTAGYKYFGKTRPVLPTLTDQEELERRKEHGTGVFTTGEKLKQIKAIIKKREGNTSVKTGS